MLRREFIASTRSTLILSISNKSSDIQKLLTREKKEGSFRLHSFCAIHDADFHSERVFFFKLKKEGHNKKNIFHSRKSWLHFLRGESNSKWFKYFWRVEKNCRNPESFNYIYFIVGSINEGEVLNGFHKKVYIEFIDNFCIMLLIKFFYWERNIWQKLTQ